MDGNGDALYFSRAPIPGHGMRPEQFAAGIDLQAHRPLCVPARFPADVRRAAADAARAREALEQLRVLEHGYRFEPSKPHWIPSGWIPRRSRARARQLDPTRRHCSAARRARTVSAAEAHDDVLSAPRPRYATRMRSNIPHSPVADGREIHLRDRRRRLVAGQGARRRLDRLPPRGPRLRVTLQKFDPVHQRRSRAR